MPYLNPAHVLEQFSEFALEEIRPAIDDDFLEGQVGSMASTLRFLSMELDAKPDALDEQYDSLETALAGVATAVDDEAVVTTAEAAAERLKDPPEDLDKLESELLDVSNEVLATIDDELTGEAAQVARQPMYEFMDTRVRTQLEMMGRQSE